jgi:tRNA(His) 5'-end guanylyltransferase
MSFSKFEQKIKSFECAYEYKIIPKIPVIIKLDARNFSINKGVDIPFDIKLSKIFGSVMQMMAPKIEGLVFGYQYSDKIFFVLKNDKTPETDPWFGNDVQKINSVVSSMCTDDFRTCSKISDIQFQNQILFSSKVFGISGSNDGVDYFIYTQLKCYQDLVNNACQSKLKSVYGDRLFSILDRKSLEERKNLLLENDFDIDLCPPFFKRGMGIYLCPKLEETHKGHMAKLEWNLDISLPLFSENRDFLYNILSTGADIFRQI